MKKSIFLFFAAILCAMSINAATVTSDGTARLYFNIKAVSWWNAGTDGNGNFGYFFNNSTGKNAWSAHAVKYSGDVYYLTIPKGDWAGVILTRNNTSTSPSWDNKWNQTGDITLSSTGNYISKFSEGSATVTWSTQKPASTASVSSSSSSVFVGAPANLTAALTSNADINTVKSVTYSTTTGANISGSTFTATAEGTYTVTATVTYHPNGYPSITSTATATTDITVTVPAEEVHDVTVSYMCGSTEIADETKISSVGVETEGDAVAPAKIKGYNFVNWTIGDGVINQTGDNTAREIKINTKSTGTYTLIANYEPETVYFVNTDEWAVVNVYAWVEDGIKNGEWPGEELTPTGEKIGGYDVYRYTSGEGYENVIFNDKVGSNDSKQTPDLVWTNGKYYVYNGQTSVDADDWYAKVDVESALPDWFATNVYLVGSMFANWDKTPDKEFRKATKDATTANIVVNLDANKDYELKVRRGDDWTSCTSKITNTVSNLQFSNSNNDNCKMKTTVAGDYTFTWTISSSKLAVTYPTICAITATANDAAMGIIDGAGEYGKGSTATLTATPNDGYLFVNWTKGGEVVATTQEYSFKVTEAVELVANFEAAPEEVRNVTVSYVCGGNKIAEDQTVAAVGVTTPKTAKAPAIFGYTFTSWTLGAGVTSADATANPISINIVAGASDYTLTANYAEIPKVKIYVVNNKKWSKVNVYGWKDGEAQGTPAWPGQDIIANKETEQVAGFDVYSYSVVPGSYDNLILNNGSGEQTGTYKWTDGKYYYVGATENYAGGTAEEVATALAPVTKYYIAGTQNLTGYDWKENGLGMIQDGELYKATFTELNAGTYEFKVTNGTWTNPWGYNNLGAAYEEVSQGKDEHGNDNGNIKFVTEEAKNITVIFDATAGKITFEGLTPYVAPLTYTVTVPAGTEKCYIAGAFAQSNWNTFLEMEQVTGEDKFTITIAGAKETDQYKYACQADWAYAEVIDGGGNRTQWTALDNVTAWNKPVVYTYYLMGVNNDWGTGIEMEVNTDAENEVMLTCQPVNGEVKIKRIGDDASEYWYGGKSLKEEEGNLGTNTGTGDEDGNIRLEEGIYNFYFNTADGKLWIAAATDCEPTPDYTRTVTAGKFGTLCLPFGSTNYTGMELFECVGKEEGSKVYIASVTTLEAGVPYIFLATGTELAVYSDGTAASAGNHNGLVGTFVDETVVAAGDYILLNNELRPSNGEAKVNANRAYLVMSDVPVGAPQQMPGRRYIGMSVQGENEATGFENITNGENTTIKVIENGQLIIIRDGVKYNAQGIKF